jgi:hypothetical protein
MLPASWSFEYPSWIQETPRTPSKFIAVPPAPRHIDCIGITSRPLGDLLVQFLQQDSQGRTLVDLAGQLVDFVPVRLLWLFTLYRYRTQIVIVLPFSPSLKTLLAQYNINDHQMLKVLIHTTLLLAMVKHQVELPSIQSYEQCLASIPFEIWHEDQNSETKISKMNQFCERARTVSLRDVYPPPPQGYQFDPHWVQYVVVQVEQLSQSPREPCEPYPFAYGSLDVVVEHFYYLLLLKLDCRLLVSDWDGTAISGQSGGKASLNKLDLVLNDPQFQPKSEWLDLVATAAQHGVLVAIASYGDSENKDPNFLCGQYLIRRILDHYLSKHRDHLPSPIIQCLSQMCIVSQNPVRQWSNEKLWKDDMLKLWQEVFEDTTTKSGHFELIRRHFQLDQIDPAHVLVIDDSIEHVRYAWSRNMPAFYCRDRYTISCFLERC